MNALSSGTNGKPSSFYRGVYTKPGLGHGPGHGLAQVLYTPSIVWQFVENMQHIIQ